LQTIVILHRQGSRRHLRYYLPQTYGSRLRMAAAQYRLIQRPRSSVPDQRFILETSGRDPLKIQTGKSNHCISNESRIILYSALHQRRLGIQPQELPYSSLPKGGMPPFSLVVNQPSHFADPELRLSARFHRQAMF
jgi:hypothetical protein